MSDARTITFSGLPLDFRLSDDDHEPVLHLDESTGRAMKLEIGNTSRDTLLVHKRGVSTASAGDHHFALRFRAGVLSGDSHDKIGVAGAAAATWSCVPSKHDNGDVSIYLLHKQEAEWAPGTSFRLTLEGLRGDRARGTRGTRLELAYGRLAYKSAPNTEVSGRRTHSLVLTPLRRELKPPLELEFRGPAGNIVLNDGTTKNALRVRLTNTTSWPLEFIPEQAKRHTRLILSFATSDDEDSSRALCTAASLEGREASVARLEGGWELRVRNPESLTSPEWIITNPNENTVSLDPGKYLEIDLPKLQTRHAAGLTNLRLQILDLGPDGEPDGEIIAAIQKSPIVIVGQSVGLGVIPQPDKGTLQVRQPGDAVMSVEAVVEQALGLAFLSSLAGALTVEQREVRTISNELFRWPVIRPSSGTQERWFPSSSELEGSLLSWADGYEPFLPPYARPTLTQEGWLPLKPDAALCARIDLTGRYAADGGPWIFFEELSADPAKRPLGSVRLAQWTGGQVVDFVNRKSLPQPMPSGEEGGRCVGWGRIETLPLNVYTPGMQWPVVSHGAFAFGGRRWHKLMSIDQGYQRAQEAEQLSWPTTGKDLGAILSPGLLQEVIELQQKHLSWVAMKPESALCVTFDPTGEYAADRAWIFFLPVSEALPPNTVKLFEWVGTEVRDLVSGSSTPIYMSLR